MKAIRSVLFVVLGLSLLGLSQQERIGHSFEVYEENGISIRETTGGPKYTGDLFTYSSVVTLQQDQSDPNSLLYRPNNRYVMDEDGRFYVADVGNHRIAVFSQAGRFVRDFGHQGEGPGEFLSLKILTLNGNVLSVWDERLRRTTLFTTAGELINTYPFPNDSYGSQDKLYVNPEGSYFPLSHIYREDPLNYDWQGWRGTTITPAGDTLAVITTPLVETSHSFFAQSYNGSVGLSIYYSGRPHLLPVPDMGILSTTGVEPEVLIHNLDGTTRLVIRIDLPVEPVTARDRQQIKAILQKQRRETESEQQRALIGSILENIRFATSKAFWNEIQTDDFGYIWLLYPSYASTREEKIDIIRVISPEGEYLGDTQWPISTGSLSNGHLLTIRKDRETGEQILEVFRIESNMRGFIYP